MSHVRAPPTVVRDAIVCCDDDDREPAGDAIEKARELPAARQRAVEHHDDGDAPDRVSGQREHRDVSGFVAVDEKTRALLALSRVVQRPGPCNAYDLFFIY